MKLFSRGKDGGPESKVWGYWLIEWKRFLSIAILRFEDGTREAFHSHAFNSTSWLLNGKLIEIMKDGPAIVHRPGLTPIKTYRGTFHMVRSEGRSWAITVRGPWTQYWHEWTPNAGEYLLKSGREKVCDISA